MRKLVTIAALALLAGAVAAQQQGRAQHGGNMPHAQQMEQMQERMQSMQELMTRIRNTENAEERQRLMQEHMETMHESMTTMHEMMGGAMMGSGSGAQSRECTEGDTQCQLMRMREQQETMNQRMGMMQRMMQQMMEHMSQREGMPMTMPESESGND